MIRRATPLLIAVPLAVALFGGVVRADDAATGGAAPLRAYQQSMRKMGTRFEITAYAASEKQAAAAMGAAFRRIDEIEQLMSDYRPDSEIRLLAARGATAAPVEISLDLRRVLEQSRAVGRASQGAFEITVSPLVELWRESRRTGVMPPAKPLAAARLLVGPQHWTLDDRGVQLKRQGVRFDLGGIAKGYALDQALLAMRQRGVSRALINGGGDIAAGDPPPQRAAWRIGVAPLEPRGEPGWIVPLVSAAVATSGDAWQFVEIDGRRYSHIVNPRTGMGVEGRVAATVVAKQAALADAWASALCVLGPNGLKEMDRPCGLTAVVTWMEGDQPRQAMSKRFQKRATPATAK